MKKVFVLTLVLFCFSMMQANDLSQLNFKESNFKLHFSKDPNINFSTSPQFETNPRDYKWAFLATALSFGYLFIDALDNPSDSRHDNEKAMICASISLSALAVFVHNLGK